MLLSLITLTNFYHMTPNACYFNPIIINTENSNTRTHIHINITFDYPLLNSDDNLYNNR